MIERREITRRAILGGALALAWTAPAHALSAGGRSLARQRAATPPMVSLIVGSEPGRAADRAARAFAPFLERHLREARIAVLNRPGGTGLTALRLLADAEPGALAIGWASSPALPARMVDSAGAANLAERLRLVGAVQNEPIVIVAAAGTPPGTVRDLLRRAGEDPASLPLGTPPQGSAEHLAVLRLQALGGTALNVVAFPSAAAARHAAAQGPVAAAALALSHVVAELRDGTLSGLGIAAPQRSEAIPEVPTLIESGLSLSAAILRGIATPASAPDAWVSSLAAALRGVVADPEYVAAAAESGFLPALVDGPAWAALVAEEKGLLENLWRIAPWSTVAAG